MYAPAMPDPLCPKIAPWVEFLKKQAGSPGEHTFFVGHSIGYQTILRYLETLSENTRVGGVALLAPWVHLTDDAFEDEEDVETAKPWFETPLQWGTIKSRANGFIAIFSDNDEVVPLAGSKIFEEKLGAHIIVEHDSGHFSGSGGIKKLPSLRDAVLRLRESNYPTFSPLLL